MTIYFAQPKKTKKPKPLVEYPISIRVTSGTDRIYIATGLKCIPKDLSKHGVKGKELNGQLLKMKEAIKAIADSPDQPSPLEVKERYLKSLTETITPDFQKHFNEYISRDELRLNTVKNLKKVLSEYGKTLNGRQPGNDTAKFKMSLKSTGRIRKF